MLWNNQVFATLAQKKLGFDFTKLRLRLGPKWFEIQLKPGQLGTKCTALLSCLALFPSTQYQIMATCLAYRLKVQR